MTDRVRCNIRPECFNPASEWLQPTKDEVRELLRRIPPNGVKGSDAGELIHVAGRQVRRWTGGDAPIPYAAWAILADFAGVPHIWIKR